MSDEKLTLPEGMKFTEIDGEKNTLSDLLFEATQLVKSGDPELADMGRKWVKELIWGRTVSVEVKSDDAQGGKLTEVMVEAIRGGRIPFQGGRIGPEKGKR